MRKKAMSLLPVIILALLVSCDGSGSDSSEGANFSTVNAFAYSEMGLYEADVGVATDTTGDGNCDSYTYFPDDITVTIEAIANENLDPSLTPCDLILVAYTVEFIPFENSPAVPTKTRYHHIVIPGPGETTGPIRIIDQEDKWDTPHPLSSDNYLAFLIAGLGVQYEYTVVVTLSLNELCTGITKTARFQLPVYYFDIVDPPC